MGSIVLDAYNVYLRDLSAEKDKEYRKTHRTNVRGNLWSSDLGKCHRAAILRTNVGSGSFDASDQALRYMNTGVITEDATLAALKHVYGSRLTDQVVLKYKMWSGKADFGIDIGTDKPILIEHKTTSEKNFDSDSKTSLPKKEHVGQAMSYMWMYEQLYKVTPKVLLFYKAWGNTAEIELVREGKTIKLLSDINGVLSQSVLEYDVYREIKKLSTVYTSGEIPDRLDKKYKGCTFMGKPSCQFYDYCWGEDDSN